MNEHRPARINPDLHVPNGETLPAGEELRLVELVTELPRMSMDARESVANVFDPHYTERVATRPANRRP